MLTKNDVFVCQFRTKDFCVINLWTKAKFKLFTFYDILEEGQKYF